MDQAYKLVWEDDFDGNTLNMDNWSYETHEPGWVNAERSEERRVGKGWRGRWGAGR